MSTQLPSDPVDLEQTLRQKIYDTLMLVPEISALVKLEKRERFPETDDEDEALTTVADPLISTMRITSIIQIGIPTVAEAQRTSDLHTQLDFTYPITFDMSVVDNWVTPIPTFGFTNSTDLFIAIYMKARRMFKQLPDGTNNRDLGFANCSHDYLQQESAATVDTDQDENGPRLHVADWTLTISCTGILV